MAAITNNVEPDKGSGQAKLQTARCITFDAEATIPEPDVKKIVSKRKFAPRMTRSEYKSLMKEKECGAAGAREGTSCAFIGWVFVIGSL